MKNTRERLKLVGAGPVGSLLALMLAHKGFKVDVFERRADMRREKISAGRSINLAVSTRGIHALSQVGMDQEILAQAMPMRGRMIHSVSGELTFQPYGKSPSDCIYSLSRAGLNRELMNAAEASGRVKIHFRHRATGLTKLGALQLFDEQQDRHFEVEKEGPIFGTDGSASALRAAVIERRGGRCSQIPLDYGYKELELPPDPHGRHFMDPQSLHIWPRGTFMLIALPNLDGSFTCTLFLPYDPLGCSPSFSGLKDRASLEQFFEREFPDVRKRLPRLEQEFFENPTGEMVTIKAEPWNLGGDCLLLGDAAHAIVPFFGQGMNCGFEDCSILDEMLAKTPDLPDWAELFESFSQSRKGNADAIAEMAVENFVEMRDKVGDPRFLLEKQVEQILMSRFPDLYLSRYSLVTFSRLPYRQALEAGVIQREILSELCRDLKAAGDLDLERAEALMREKSGPTIVPG